MVKNVAEKSVEDSEGGVDLSLVVALDEGEEDVEKVLPDGIVLLLDHGALNLDSHIADFMHVNFVGSVCSLECLQNSRLDLGASTVAQALPQVLVVALVAQV